MERGGGGSNRLLGSRLRGKLGEVRSMISVGKMGFKEGGVPQGSAIE